jgi:hypothetical protein
MKADTHPRNRMGRLEKRPSLLRVREKHEKAEYSFQDKEN